MQTILASKVQLRISYYQCHFVFSDMSNIAVKTHTIHAVWCQVGYNILLDSIRIESTDGNFGTHEKAAIPIPILTCTLPIPLCSHAHLYFPPLHKPKLLLNLATPEDATLNRPGWWLHRNIVYQSKTVTCLRNNQLCNSYGFSPYSGVVIHFTLYCPTSSSSSTISGITTLLSAIQAR